MKVLKTDRSAVPGIVLAGWIAVLLPGAPMRAETLYVTDMLQLELYATADMTGPLLRRLKSGDRLEVLESGGSRTRVQLDNGQQGWVKSLYLVEKEPARTRLNEVERTNERLEASLLKIRAQLDEQKGQVKELEGIRNNEDTQQTEAAAELERLRIENTDMRDSLVAYAGSVPISWFLTCLLVVLVGGFALGWYWFDSRSRARHGGYRIH